jgi:acetamidase/formamidase
MVMVGDVHANQGDSEIAMGIEVDGTVTLRLVDLVRGENIPYARIETADRWVFPADAPTLEEAIEQSALYAAEFLVERLGISMEDATYLLCAVGDVRISQAAFAYYNVTVRTEVPKSVDRRGRLAGYAG